MHGLRKSSARILHVDDVGAHLAAVAVFAVAGGAVADKLLPARCILSPGRVNCEENQSEDCEIPLTSKLHKDS
jgi:hypothetical protein